MLHVLRPFDGIECARKLGQHTIAGRLDDLATMACGFWTDDAVKDSHPALMRARLVARHRDRVPDDVHERDGRKAAIETRNAYFLGRAFGHECGAPLNGLS